MLLSSPLQGPPLDVWSAGVIFLSLLCKRYPLLPGRSDEEQLLTLTLLMKETLRYGSALALGKEMAEIPFASAASATVAGGLFGLIGVSRSSEPGFEDAFNLVLALLDPDPGRRITAAGALTHPFFIPSAGAGAASAAAAAAPDCAMVEEQEQAPSPPHFSLSLQQQQQAGQLAQQQQAPVPAGDLRARLEGAMARCLEARKRMGGSEHGEGHFSQRLVEGSGTPRAGLGGGAKGAGAAGVEEEEGEEEEEDSAKDVDVGEEHSGERVED